MNTNSPSLLDIEELPRFLKEKIVLPDELPNKDLLTDLLVKELELFFSVERIHIDSNFVYQELKTLPQQSVPSSFAKLRSIFERSVRKEITEFCRNLEPKFRRELVDALHSAGKYSFRDNLETDLYVGIHTAVSANFKMLGLAYSVSGLNRNELDFGLQQLFRTLRYVASLPLGILTAFDGLFWDSAVYFIPSAIVWTSVNSKTGFFVEADEITTRVEKAFIEEKPTGCPAMRAKTPLGLRAIDLVQQSCVEMVQTYWDRRSG